MLNFRIVFTLFCMVVVYTASAQCLNPIKEYVSDAVRLSEPKDKQVYFAEFEVRNIPTKSSGKSPITVVSKMYRSKGQLVYETKDVTLYQDEHNSFMVIKPLKRIIWSKEQKNTEETKVNTMAEIQKILLSDSKLIYCTSKTNSDGHEIIQAKLQLKQEIQDEIKVRFSIIDFDLTDNEFLKVETIFGEGHELDRQIVTYRELDFNYKGFKTKPIRTMIFDKNGRLLPAYRSYTLIEN